MTQILGEIITTQILGEIIMTQILGEIIMTQILGEMIITQNTWGDDNHSNLFNTTQPMNNKILGSYIQNKDFTLQSYMYSNDYEVKIFKASDGNIYSKYFNGTADVITLIP
jgi:hypothetical protein